MNRAEDVRSTVFPFLYVVSFVVTSVALCATPTPAQKSTGGGAVNLTAASANVSESGSPVKIQILRWSTDEERAPVVAALTPVAPVTAPAEGTGGPPAGAAANAPADAEGRGGAGRGGAAAAGRGRVGAGRGGRGGAGRGGRGAGGPVDPIAALTAAIDRAPTIGYLWTTEITGYSIKYAHRASLPEGGERIILATNRRLGAYAQGWSPVAAPPNTDYDFTLIEIRLDAKGLGEGKTSITTKVVVDNEARTVALANYAATPALLENVRR